MGLGDVDNNALVFAGVAGVLIYGFQKGWFDPAAKTTPGTTAPPYVPPKATDPPPPPVTVLPGQPANYTNTPAAASGPTQALVDYYNTLPDLPPNSLSWGEMAAYLATLSLTMWNEPWTNRVKVVNQAQMQRLAELGG